MVWSGGTVVSPRMGGRKTYWFLAEIWSSVVEVVRPDGTGGFTCTDGRETYWLFQQKFQLFFFGLKMWYGSVVGTYATVPMVVKLTGTCETYNLCAFLHMPLYINITSKITKENSSIYNFKNAQMLVYKIERHCYLFLLLFPKDLMNTLY